ncbi:MAG: AzlC family ABC transporter permease [Tissierellia bacterium]|nr:AzlC family ABC transporter permease [Tissierellia bacterium]
MTFSYLFVGIAYGLLIAEKNYSLLWLISASVFIYAGSMQIVLISLMTSGVPLYLVALMTFVINARHMFYGIGFVDRFKRMGLAYPYMVLTLTDETYSVMCNLKYPKDVNEKTVDFTIAFGMHLLWVLSCVSGYLFGSLLPIDLTGIEFSATTFFICVVVNQWMTFDSHIPAITGLVSALVFLVTLGPDRFILPALSVSLIALVFLRDRVELGKRGGSHARRSQ